LVQKLAARERPTFEPGGQRVWSLRIVVYYCRCNISSSTAKFPFYTRTHCYMQHCAITHPALEGRRCVRWRHVSPPPWLLAADSEPYESLLLNLWFLRTLGVSYCKNTRGNQFWMLRGRKRERAFPHPPCPLPLPCVCVCVCV